MINSDRSSPDDACVAPAAATIARAESAARSRDGQRALTLCRDRSYCGCICGERLMRTAAAGQASKAAAEVAADIVNNKHPELADLPLAATEGLPNQGGAKLELIFVDHQGNPSVAQQQALRLITQEKVHVLFGAYQ